MKQDDSHVQIVPVYCTRIVPEEKLRSSRERQPRKNRSFLLRLPFK